MFVSITPAAVQTAGVSFLFSPRHPKNRKDALAKENSQVTGWNGILFMLVVTVAFWGVLVFLCWMVAVLI